MASFTTTLVGHSEKSNSRSYEVDATHTVEKPHLVIQTRKEALGNQVIAQDNLVVSLATEDADGNILPQRNSFEAVIRRPKNGSSTDTTANLAIFRDLVASDEFTAIATRQQYIKE
jgi:hypothetical protein